MVIEADFIEAACVEVLVGRIVREVVGKGIEVEIPRGHGCKAPQILGYDQGTVVVKASAATGLIISQRDMLEVTGGHQTDGRGKGVAVPVRIKQGGTESAKSVGAYPQPEPHVAPTIIPV